jgi:hypothetical protein
MIFILDEPQQQKNKDFDGLLPHSEAAFFGYPGHFAIYIS